MDHKCITKANAKTAQTKVVSAVVVMAEVAAGQPESNGHDKIVALATHSVAYAPGIHAAVS